MNSHFSIILSVLINYNKVEMFLLAYPGFDMKITDAKWIIVTSFNLVIALSTNNGR